MCILCGDLFLQGYFIIVAIPLIKPISKLLNDFA